MKTDDNKVKVSVRESAIRKMLREALAVTPPEMKHSHRDDKVPSPQTVPSAYPITPSEHSATQLSVQRPPVEDPEFVPSGTVELGRAISALAGVVPSEAVERFYRSFIKLIDDTLADEPALDPMNPSAVNEGVADDLAHDKDALYFRVERRFTQHDLDQEIFNEMVRAVEDEWLSEKDFESILNVLKMEPGVEPGASVAEALRGGEIEQAAELVQPKKRGASKTTAFFSKYANALGYAGPSGLFGAMLHDVEPQIALRSLGLNDRVRSSLEPQVRSAFESVIFNDEPNHVRFMKLLLDDNGFDDLVSMLDTMSTEELEVALEDLEIYRYFRSSIYYAAATALLDDHMQRNNGQVDPKKLVDEASSDVKGKALEILSSLRQRDKFRGLFAASVAMAAEDADFDDFGSYLEPALATLRKLSSGTAPPARALARTIVDPKKPAGKQFLGAVDKAYATANRVMRKAAKKRTKS